MKEDRSIRAARAEMDAAREQSEKAFSEKPGTPRRYKIYDRIRDKVSLRTVDLVITVTAIAIVGLLIYGILTGNRAQ